MKSFKRNFKRAVVKLLFFCLNFKISLLNVYWGIKIKSNNHIKCYDVIGKHYGFGRKILLTPNNLADNVTLQVFRRFVQIMLKKILWLQIFMF